MSGAGDVQILRRLAEQTKRADDKSWYAPDWTDAEWGATVTPDVVLALLDAVDDAAEKQERARASQGFHLATALVYRTELRRVRAERDALRETVARVEALADGWTDGRLYSIHTAGWKHKLASRLRDALDSQRHTGTPDASQAAAGPVSASEGHVSATDLAQAAARTKQAARERVGRREGRA